MAMPRWTLTLEEAHAALVQAVGMAAGSPVYGSGLPELAERHAKEGRKRFMDMFMTKAPKQAICELLAGTHREGLHYLNDGRRWDIGSRGTLDVIRFETMLTLLDEDALDCILDSELNDFKQLLEHLAENASGLFQHQYVEAAEVFARKSDVSKSASLLEPGIVKRDYTLDAPEQVEELNRELVKHWTLIAKDQACGNLYMNNSESTGMSFRLVHDISANFVGQLMLTNTGAKMISGEELMSYGLYPAITDLTALTHSSQFQLWNHVKNELANQGFDNLVRVDFLETDVALCVNDILNLRDNRSDLTSYHVAVPKMGL